MHSDNDNPPRDVFSTNIVVFADLYFAIHRSQHS